jgi:hypothetical protein
MMNGPNPIILKAESGGMQKVTALGVVSLFTYFSTKMLGSEINDTL